MRFVDKLRYKLRYNPAPRLLINALKRLGIVILPYYLLRRSLAATRRAAQRTDARLEELDDAAMEHIAALPMANNDAATYRRWRARGQQCFGLYLDDELVGFCWMDGRECSFPGERFALAADEAYAFDIYTVPSRRGQNLAPLLNACFSEHLLATGTREVVSVIDCFNRPSLAFADKIGARRERMNLYLRLFGLWERSYVLRRYPAPAAQSSAT